MSKTFLVLFGLTAALTGSAVAQTTGTTRTTDYSFPILGLAITETIGVNLVNLAVDTTTQSSQCTGSVTFINGDGTIIGTSILFRLVANNSTSINLAFANAGLAGQRGLIRTIVESKSTANVPCALSFTLNTFDTSTGVTHIFLAGPSGTQASGISSR